MALKRHINFIFNCGRTQTHADALTYTEALSLRSMNVISALFTVHIKLRYLYIFIIFKIYIVFFFLVFYSFIFYMYVQLYVQLYVIPVRIVLIPWE